MREREREREKIGGIDRRKEREPDRSHRRVYEDPEMFMTRSSSRCKSDMGFERCYVDRYNAS